MCRAPFPTRNYSSAPLACHYPSPEADPAEADAYTCSSTFHETRRACNCDFFPFELSTRPSRVPVSFELYPRDQWKSRFQASCRSRSTATKGTSRRLERNRRARNDRVSMENARQEDIPDNWEMTFRKTITNFRYTESCPRYGRSPRCRLSFAFRTLSSLSPTRHERLPAFQRNLALLRTGHAIPAATSTERRSLSTIAAEISSRRVREAFGRSLARLEANKQYPRKFPFA